MRIRSLVAQRSLRYESASSDAVLGVLQRRYHPHNAQSICSYTKSHYLDHRNSIPVLRQLSNRATNKNASQNPYDPTQRLSRLLHVSTLLLHSKRQGSHRYAVLLNNSQNLSFKANRHLLKTCWLAKKCSKLGEKRLRGCGREIFL